MGKRGPHPTPTSVLERRGSWRAKGRGNEPRPKKGKPRPPDWLGRVAKHAFRWVVNTLEDMRILTLADAKAIERYAQTYQRWREAEQMLSAHGQILIVRREDGSEMPKKSPAVAVAAELAHQLARLEADLGLTPAARVGLVAGPILDREREDRCSRFFVQRSH
jgi:P27 family predicted phage terminase small subunit